jgi:hypothetical protein
LAIFVAAARRALTSEAHQRAIDRRKWLGENFTARECRRLQKIPALEHRLSEIGDPDAEAVTDFAFSDRRHRLPICIFLACVFHDVREDVRYIARPTRQEKMRRRIRDWPSRHDHKSGRQKSFRSGTN